MADAFTNSTLGTIPGLMGLGLAGYAAGNAMRQFPRFNPRAGGPKIKHPFALRTNPRVPSAKPFVKGAVNLMIGTALLGATAGAISKV